jgi:hypothetical protein
MQFGRSFTKRADSIRIDMMESDNKYPYLATQDAWVPWARTGKDLEHQWQSLGQRGDQETMDRP